jgi:RHS repeat-associated protein
MGELIGNIHTYVVPGGEPYTFEMRWNYDSWNRLINIQYPDGELVSYRYDNGGKLISMNGEKLGQQYYYIKEIIYDKFDSRTNIFYGNGTYSEYYYDPLNRRLKNLKSYDANGHKMHDIAYGYDGVGNILYQSNNGEYVYNGAGGPYKYDYKYDELYRLIHSGGNFESNNGSMYYNLNMSYSPSGNITNKQLYGQTLINGGVNNIDYNRDYQYNGRPHQVTNAGENAYKWDGNGNMIFRNTPQGRRYQCWDNEDRLVAVHDEGDMPQISAYLYDGGGERVWKLTGGVMQNYMNGQQIYNSVHLDKTLYASPYMVMTEQEYTKHYYIEGERICSKIGGGFQGAHTPPTSHPIDFIAGSADICSMRLREMVGRNVQCASYNGDIYINPDLPPAHNDGNEYEKLQYFYHSDHLGSASFVTNAEGAVMQHLQYFPYGELFVSQRNSEEFDSRYKFTAKELDNETSYTYFGARYYDSELSAWLSVDPMSDKYPSTSAYMYCSG